METNVRLYSLLFRDIMTYGAALLFLSGNIILPRLFHLLPEGGATWLPIYFFTLVGAYKYGWKVGLLTAVLSPLSNSWLFGMPMPVALPAILTKSVLLAVGAGYAAHRYKKVSLLLFLAVTLFYQVAGTVAEWAMGGSFYAAVQDFRIGIPGMLSQILGGYLFVKHLIRN